MDIKDLLFDTQASSEGRWVDNIPDLGDARLRVRGLRSPQYRLALEREMRKVPRKKKDSSGEVLLDERIRITTKLIHEVLLLEWDGFVHNGKPLPYDPKIAALWCTDPKYVRFADAVVFAANVVDNLRVDQEEDAVGN